MEYIRKHRVDFIVAALLAVITAALHFQALNNNWLFDDLQVLRQANEYSPWEYFFIPSVWHDVSLANFTPLVTLSFDLDYNLFGFRPIFFYIHQFFSVWVAAVMLYAVLRLWVPRTYALCGSLLFSVSAPVIYSAEFLCLRHYVEGSIFILASLLWFVNSLRKNNVLLACLSATFYLLAMLAKEVYIPFLFVILFLPEEKWSSRLKFALPHVTALCAYLVWRSQMLGRTMGGYGAKFFESDNFSDILRLVLSKGSESIKMLAGNSPMSGTVNIAMIVVTGILLLTALFFLARRGKYAGIIFVAVFIAAVYAPISPYFTPVSAADFVTYRLLFHFALGYASLIVFAAYELSLTKKSPAAGLGVRLRVGMLLMLVVMTSLIFVSSYWWLNKQREALVRPLTAETNFLMGSDPNNIMVKSNILPNVSSYEMMDYFRRLNQRQQIPYVVYDVFFGVSDDSASDLEGRRVFKFSKAEGSMTDITQEFIAKRREFFSRVRNLPLEVRLEIENEAAVYSLGPSDTGRYFLLVGCRPGVYSSFVGPLSRYSKDKITVGKNKWYIRFCWESPDGWFTFSPEWLVDFSRDQKITWRRQD